MSCTVPRVSTTVRRRSVETGRFPHSGRTGSGRTDAGPVESAIRVFAPQTSSSSPKRQPRRSSTGISVDRGWASRTARSTGRYRTRPWSWRSRTNTWCRTTVISMSLS